MIDRHQPTDDGRTEMSETTQDATQVDRCRWGINSHRGACGSQRVVGVLRSPDGTEEMPVCEDHTEALYGTFVPLTVESTDA